jgi:hypothetical protein
LPLGTNDFSSALLQAQASKADAILLANAGGDTVNTIKQAADFKITEKQKVVALIFDLQSVPAIGLGTAQGLQAINGWYWDTTDGAREFSKRYAERHSKKMYPNHMQAGVYSATLAYLKAVDKSRLAGRRQGRGRRHEGHAVERSGLWQGRDPPRWPRHSPAGPVASESARGIEKRLGPVQGRGHHSCRQGVPSAGRWRLSAGQVAALVARSRFQRHDREIAAASHQGGGHAGDSREF